MGGSLPQDQTPANPAVSLRERSGQALVFGSMRQTIQDEVRQNVLIQWSTRSAGKK